MPRKGWTTIALPDELIKEVDRIIKSRVLGYRNRQEFVKDAVRRRIEELKRLEIYERRK